MSLEALFPTLNAPIATASGPLSPSDDFEVLGLALGAAGLTDTVQGLEDFTLFAPTDAAFGELATNLGFTGDTENAGDVFGHIAGALAGLDPNGDPIPLLTDILLYHVSPEDQNASDLNADGPVATLLDGASFEVTGGAIIDNDPDAENADIVAPDVDIPQGSVQVVDQVLLPLDTPAAGAEPTLLETLEESGGSPDDNAADFDLLLTALQATGLDAAVDDEDASLTVFLPNDGAFVGLAQDLGYDGEDEGEALQTILDASAEADPENPLGLVTDILTYHVVPEQLGSADVLAADTIGTLQGGDITVEGATLVDNDPDNAVANLLTLDIETANGTGHVIDQVLLPDDIPDADDDPDTPEDEVVAADDGGDDFGSILAFGLLGILALALGGLGGAM
ncbi:MAG: fasciclin domain-containing protein [Roseovarius sp.]